MAVANVGDYIITEHVKDRWNDRTPQTPTDVTEAWVRANDLCHVTPAVVNGDPETQSARIYVGKTPDGIEYEVLFIAKGDAVVTCYPYNGMGDGRVEAYIDRIVEKTRFYE
jgi:hypothetical protein